MSRPLPFAGVLAGALLASGCAGTGGLQPVSAPRDAADYALTRSLAGAPLSDAAFPTASGGVPSATRSWTH